MNFGMKEENQKMTDWEILELEPTTDIVKIKQMYAKQVKKYHPEDFPEEFKCLQKAYKAAIQYAKNAAAKKPETYHMQDFFAEQVQLDAPQEECKEEPKPEQEVLLSKENASYEQESFEAAIEIVKEHFTPKDDMQMIYITPERVYLLALDDYMNHFLFQELMVQHIENWATMFDSKCFGPFFEMEIVWYLLAEKIVKVLYLKNSICQYILYQFQKHEVSTEFALYFRHLFQHAKGMSIADDHFVLKDKNELLCELANDFCKNLLQKVENKEYKDRKYLFVFDSDVNEFLEKMARTMHIDTSYFDEEKENTIPSKKQVVKNRRSNKKWGTKCVILIVIVIIMFLNLVYK